MKKNPAFRLRVMQSKYFQPSGHESLADVIHSFGDPFGLPVAYAHMQRHQASDLIAAKKRFEGSTIASVHNSGPNKVVVAVGAVEGQVISQGEHETALDEFIRVGHEKLQAREMTISATNFLKAIEVRANINKNTKDRRMEMIKSFFSGGSKKEATNDR